MANRRALRPDEIDEARKVFKDTINYQKVFVERYGDGAMTWAYENAHGSWYWIIFWSKGVYSKGAVNAGETRTFIHEMTHVWQGLYGTLPREYMFKSTVAQSKGVWDDVWDKGVRELLKRVWNNGPLGAWHSHRSRAYVFSMNDIGAKSWNDFNVEQQASIVESWYAPNDEQNYLGENIPGGNMSPTDPRYPYISGNILARSVNAKYVPPKAPTQNNQLQLGKGADPKIKQIQDILVQLRYLDPKHADGYMGKHTRDAVIGFQRNNGLKPDGDIGGPNSATRKKMGVR